MPKKENPFKGIGPYNRPSPVSVQQTRDAVVRAGGAVSDWDLVHRAVPVDYKSDPVGLAKLRKEPIGPEYTCACGRPGVEVGLLNVVVGTGRPGEKNRGGEAVHACIHCDAVHRMPKFSTKPQPGKEANG